MYAAATAVVKRIYENGYKKKRNEATKEQLTGNVYYFGKWKWIFGIAALRFRYRKNKVNRIFIFHLFIRSFDGFTGSSLF